MSTYSRTEFPDCTRRVTDFSISHSITLNEHTICEQNRKLYAKTRRIANCSIELTDFYAVNKSPRKLIKTSFIIFFPPLKGNNTERKKKARVPLKSFSCIKRYYLISFEILNKTRSSSLAWIKCGFACIFLSLLSRPPWKIYIL